MLNTTPVLLKVSDVETEDVKWLWQDRIPIGKMTIIEGDPGQGKSWATLAIATAVTLGKKLPGKNQDSKSKPADVLLISAEDGAADTIRPRLEKMGADIERVTILMAVKDEEGKERHLSLVDDLDAVDKALSWGGYGLVVIDPLNAYLGASLDTNRDAAMRSVLTPLTRLAEKHNVALICIRHLTKSGREKAIYRGQGSIAYTAAARVVHLIGTNPDNKSERVIVCTKNNLSPLSPAFAFEIKGDQFKWKGETDVDVERLIKCDKSNRKSAIDNATEFLLKALSEGPRSSNDVSKEARQIGISVSTLKRARKEMHVQVNRKGGSKGHWVWSLDGETKKVESEEEDSRTSLEEAPTQGKKVKKVKGSTLRQLTLLDEMPPCAE